METVSPSPTVISISLGFVNVFLIKSQRPILIDTGIPGSKTRILEQIAANGVDLKTIALIVITHVHTDHSGEAAALQAATGAQVAVHRLEADLLRQGKSQEVVPTSALARLAAKMTQAQRTPPGVAPDVLIDDELDLAAWGVNGKIISTPGHTPGSVSVCLSGGEVIIGDLLMSRMFRRRTPASPMFANDLQQVQESVQRVLACQPTQILASHGGPFDPQVVARQFKISL